MMDLSRRSFLAGIGSVTVGLLFHKKLDRIIGELEAEMVTEPVTLGQLPAAAEIICECAMAFRPSRLIVSPTPTDKTEWVSVTRYEACPKCGKNHFEGDEVYDDFGDVIEGVSCDGPGHSYVKTGEMKEQRVTAYPWVIEDITIGKQSQFLAGDGVPAELFRSDSVDTAMTMDVAGPGAEIKFRVRYVGKEPEGAIFRGALMGHTMDGRMAVLPILSPMRIAA